MYSSFVIELQINVKISERILRSALRLLENGLMGISELSMPAHQPTPPQSVNLIDVLYVYFRIQSV